MMPLPIGLRVAHATPIEKEDVLNIWTLYERPRDYPNQCVARRFQVLQGGDTLVTNDMFVANTIEELRRLIPRGLFRLPRDPRDDKAIVETWL
jgi:hypothetical protein